MLSNVAVLAFDGVAPFELGVLHEAWGSDRSDDGLPVMDFAICAPEVGPVISQGGFSMVVDQDLYRAAEADLLAVPACQEGRPVPEAVLRVLREGHARGAKILSLCTGAFVLGEAGLLDGRSCTTHWRHSDRLAARFPAARVVPEVLYVDDGQVLTSAGTAAGIDACLHHVRCELGASVANLIARRMVVPPQRDGGQRQYIDLPVPNCSADSLTPLLTWMREHLAEDQPVRLLAKRAAMSERTFARRFAAETGTTPGKWLLAQRLHHARTLLESTDLAVETVATRAGFGSAALLRHHFGAAVGVAPAEYRRTFRTPDVRAG
jgi:AraC family transcriptional regulator, transcriptional activator FtrA